jgi:hypothetical protein
MRLLTLTAAIALGALTLGPSASSQSENQGQGQAVVTILPSKDSSQPAAKLNPQAVTLKVGGKDASVANITPAQSTPLELVILLDSGARTSLSTQMGDIQQFVQQLPPNTRVTFAYMQNGIAKLTGPLTPDRSQALKGLHIPSGTPGEDASPYFCLSDLAKHWPSGDRSARREVVMVSDGVDYYHPGLDLDDPYVQAAINDSARAGVVVYSIYWENRGRYDRTMAANTTGQCLLLQVTKATGGQSYWEGLGNPVSFRPFLQDLTHRLQNQYELSFTAPLNRKPGVEDLKLKLNGVSAKVDAPGAVYVTRATM